MKQVTRLFPVFAVSDLGAALDFYQRVLGFTVAWTWGTPATRAGVALDDIEIQLDETQNGTPGGPSVVYCHMTGVESYYAECKARGADFTLELGQRPWGMMDFRIEDPDGNRIGFGSAASELESPTGNVP